MITEIQKSLLADQSQYGVDLSPEQVEKLGAYYEFVLEHNPILHLVGPCSAEDFARRHILESLTLLHHLPEKALIADIGAGAGLPSIPCLLVREGLRANLIESKEKKTVFLLEVCEKLGLTDRVKITNKQFEEADIGGADIVTCRALDKFTQKLPKILRWSKGRRRLFFGGPNLREALIKQGCDFKEELMPMSEQRFLFRVNA